MIVVSTALFLKIHLQRRRRTGRKKKGDRAYHSWSWGCWAGKMPCRAREEQRKRGEKEQRDDDNVVVAVVEREEEMGFGLVCCPTITISLFNSLLYKRIIIWHLPIDCSRPELAAASRFFTPHWLRIVRRCAASNNWRLGGSVHPLLFF